MGIGGGIITRKLLFAVLLISSLSLAGIASASASDVVTTQIQACDSSTVQEKANIKMNDADNLNKSATTQNSVDKNAKALENTSITTECANTERNIVKTRTITQDTASTSDNQATTTLTTNSTNSTGKNSVNIGINAQNAVSTADVNNSLTSSTNETSNTISTTQDSGSTQEQDNLQAAAGETKTITNKATMTSTSFTLSQIKDAASRVKAYIETNHKLPNYVTIDTTQVQMPDFLKLLTAGLLKLNSGSTSEITFEVVNTPKKPTESIKSGNITKSGYLDLAKRVNAFIDANGVLPNYATSTLGKLRYESLIYTFSKILDFQKTNNRLPSYVTVKPWSTISSGSSGSTIPSDYQKFLKSTTNCQVSDTNIKSLAAKITNGKTTAYAKAVAIFNWVRDNIGYSFYYNTKKGAVGTLNAKTGNCVDTSHLLIALSRAVGIPAKYVHGSCKFTSGNTYGHVWGQIWVDSKWYNADATSSKNSFGVIKNWNTATYTLKGTYASLPF